MKTMLLALQLLLVSALGLHADTIKTADLRNLISEEVEAFHNRRIEKLSDLKLESVLLRKNPYLLKASGVEEADPLVRQLLDLYLASQEAGLFGTTLEKLAIFTCETAYGGRKSGIEGVDLEFEKDGSKYIVSVKSGPSWGNSSSIKAMRDHFATAKRVLGTNTTGASVIAVNGCCYGRENNPDKGDYLKLCGQPFWELLSGDPDLYLKIHKLIGDEFDTQRDAFDNEYDNVVKRLTVELEEGYCDKDGVIDWNKILEMNSGAAKPKEQPSDAK